MIHKLVGNIAAIIEESEIDIPRPDRGLTSERVSDGLQVFFGIAAAVALLMIAISALKIVISRGNSQDVQKARDAIIHASIGLAISMSAFVIVAFVVERV